MAITEDEYEDLTDNIHAWDIRDQLDNAKDPELSEALWKLYQKAKNIIDPEYCEFDENTNQLLVDLHDDADEILSEIAEVKESLDSVYDMLTKITEAMPESIFEE